VAAHFFNPYPFTELYPTLSPNVRYLYGFEVVTAVCMPRDNRVRLSDDEKEAVKTARHEMYGEVADEIPLGAVIGTLAEREIMRQRSDGDTSEA